MGFTPITPPKHILIEGVPFKLKQNQPSFNELRAAIDCCFVEFKIMHNSHWREYDDNIRKECWEYGRLALQQFDLGNFEAAAHHLSDAYLVEHDYNGWTGHEWCIFFTPLKLMLESQDA